MVDGNGVHAPIVVKVGGSTLGSHDTTLGDIASLHRAGTPVVIVHGGGAAVSKALEASGLPVRFHNGLRVTDKATLEVMVSVIAGTINATLVGQLGAAGVPAVGLTGMDGPTLHCDIQDADLGFVGAVRHVDTRLLETLLRGGFVPVVAPVGMLDNDERASGQALNLNADTAAGFIAAALSAQALVLLTDVDGVHGAEGELLSTLTGSQVTDLKAAGVITGGMLPKVAAAMVAVERGVTAIIADGRASGTLSGALTGTTGTRITP